MSVSPLLYVAGTVLAFATLRWSFERWLLWRAQPSRLIAWRCIRWVSTRLPYYGFSDDEFCAADGAPAEIAAQRRRAFSALGERLRGRRPRSLAVGTALRSGLSDAQFTRAHRVPFQFRERVARELETDAVVDAARDRRIRDVDEHWHYDLTGAYGVNVLGYEAYKSCIDAAVERVGALGPVLGPYHPIVADNVERLKRLSGLDEVSFHMSGTEAVMQAVRLARFHTGRSHLVRFQGAYHGWWDGVQAGLGNERVAADAYTLRDMSRASLRVLERRRDIACVLVNPLQAMHPNASAPGDGTLVDSSRRAGFDKAAYTAWLRALRRVCDRRGIPLVLDEVLVGFRLAPGGAQQYFGVAADLVTYGKTVGGGLPIGVVCGRRELMRRFDERHPARVCFARGTFNAHPYVMAAMNEFLKRIGSPRIRASYAALDATWDARARRLNERLATALLPVRVTNLASVWTVLYERPSRYNWMLQYYLRAQGLMLGWIGTGRLIFSHDYTDEDFDAVAERFVAAAENMERDGWWWPAPGATNRAIKLAILRELLIPRRRALKRSRSVPPSP